MTAGQKGGSNQAYGINPCSAHLQIDSLRISDLPNRSSMGSSHGFPTARWDHEWWGETPSSPDLQWIEIRARRSLAPPGFTQSEPGHPMTPARDFLHAFRFQRIHSLNDREHDQTLDTAFDFEAGQVPSDILEASLGSGRPLSLNRDTRIPSVCSTRNS